MVFYRSFVFLIVLLPLLVVEARAGVCPRIKSKFCQNIDGLGYDRTFFPNVFGHIDQRQAKEALKVMEPLAKTECSPYISAFLCAAYLPACPVWKDFPQVAQRPCRELCEAARKDCEDELFNELGMEWPAELNCDDFPMFDASRRNPPCTNYVVALPPRPAFCNAHKDVGPCHTYKPYWYYDVNERKCMTFTFGGCLGNKNKFESKEECLKICGNDDTSTIASVTTQTNGGVSDGTMMSSASERAAGVKGTTMVSGNEETAGFKTTSASGSMTSSSVSGQTATSMDVSSFKPSDRSTAKLMDGGSSSQAPGDLTETPTMPTMEKDTTQGMATTMMFSTQSSRTTNEPDGLPVIVNNLDNQVVISGGSVEFRCIALGATEYSWKRVDGEYPLEKVDMEDFDRIQGAVLRMVDLAPEDAGIYACVASNSDGYVEALVTLTVVVAPTIETIETPQLVRDGGRLEIPCLGDGVPPPTMLWERKNGMKVRSKGGRSRRTLVIKNASPSDAGIYYCIAVNQAGHSNYTVEVQIEAPVEIVDDIRSQTIMENETAFFVCSATGNPEPEFSWRRLNGEFPDESRVVIEGPVVNQTLGYPIYTSILGIEPAIGSDTGSYQCYAYNSVGNYTAVGDLIVVGVPGFFQKPEADQAVSVGDSAYFTCIGSGAPLLEITWSKDGDSGWPGEDSRVFFDDENTFLRIDDVVPEDSGLYVCTVQNDFGMVKANSYLEVEGGNVTTTFPTEGGDVSVSGPSMESGTDHMEGMETSMPGSPMTDGSSMASGTMETVYATPMEGRTVSEGMASSEPTDATDAPDASPETQGSTERMETKGSTELMASGETQGSTEPMGSPETQGSTESMGSPGTQGSTEPMGSPGTHGSTELMATPDPQGSPEPGASTEGEMNGSTMAMSPGTMEGDVMGSPMSTNSPDMMSSKGRTSPLIDVMTSPMMKSEPAEVKPRRTDITNPGLMPWFSGWVDVQGQGAANDFCRIVEIDEGEFQLACSLAGTEGEEELNYVSEVGFDKGEEYTFYMKDENGDGRDDYCRCTSQNGKRYVWCTAAGENGFHGNEKDEPGTDEYSFPANGEKTELKKCRRRYVDPFFGIPYEKVN